MCNASNKIGIRATLEYVISIIAKLFDSAEELNYLNLCPPIIFFSFSVCRRRSCHELLYHIKIMFYYLISIDYVVKMSM